MEEGGGTSLADITRRLEAWDSRGRRELEEVAAYHRAIGVGHLFGERPPLQRTWAQLIRVALAAQGQPCDRERIRQYQARALGTPHGDTCLVELFPLPSPNTRTWLYRDHATLPYLTDRERYRSHVAPLRLAHLRAALARHQPRAVICYGLNYEGYWKQLAEGCAWTRSPAGFVWGRQGQTLVVLARHPAARGVGNAYFQRIGSFLAAPDAVSPQE